MSSSHFVPNLVSIITPAYNSEKVIAETIRSAIAQSYQDWEMLVVIDAGTTDQTAQVVSSLKDPRIRIIQIPDQRGLALSRNRAIAEARGQYIAFLDSDDIWFPDKLAHQIDFMKKNGASFSTAGYRRMTAERKDITSTILPPHKITYQSLLRNNQISCLTAMLDISVTGKSFFKEQYLEDYIYWLQILKAGHVCYGIREDLARYRVLATSRSRLDFLPRVRWQIYREIEGLGFVKSLYFLFYYMTTAVLKRLI